MTMATNDVETVLELGPEITEETVEDNFKANISYLERNVIVSDLIAYYEPFTAEEKRNLHQKSQTDHVEAIRSAFRLIDEQKVADKYTQLLIALENAGSPKLVEILKGMLVPGNAVNRQRIHSATRHLYEQLTPSNVLPYLVQYGVITIEESQKITNKEKYDSLGQAVLDLIFMLPNRKKNWYTLFLQALVYGDEHTQLAECIDPRKAKQITAQKLAGIAKNITESTSSLELPVKVEEERIHSQRGMAESETVAGGRDYRESIPEITSLYESAGELIDPWCDPCYDESGKKVRSDAFCSECNSFVCKPCHDAHKKSPASKKHRILQGKRMPKSKAEISIKYVKCDIHPTNVNDKFCMDHNKMLCSQCCHETHKPCRHTTILALSKDIGSTDIQQLQDVINSVKQTVISKKTKVEQNSNDIENQKSKIISVAKAFRDKLISKLQDLFSDMVSNIYEVCRQKRSHLSDQTAALTHVIHSLEEMANNINTTVNVNFDPNVFIKIHDAVETVHQYQREFQDLQKQLYKVELTFSPSPNISALLSIKNPLGSVKEVSSQLDIVQPIPEVTFRSLLRNTIKTTTRAGRKPRDISQIKAKKMSPLNVKTADDKDTFNISGIDVTRNGILLLTDWNKEKVKVFSPDSKLLSSLTLSGQPYDITVIDDKTAAVGTYDEKLHILDISDPRSLSIQRSVSLGYWAIGLASCNNKLVIIKWTAPRCVEMIDLNGHELWSASSDRNGQQLFENPHSVTTNIINNTLTIIVTDCEKDTITLLDANNGDLIKTIDVKGKGPRGLTVDSNGNVYVCHRTPREISVWSADFSQSRILLSSSYLQPKPVSIVYCDSTDEIVICYYDMDTVDRFQLS